MMPNVSFYKKGDKMRYFHIVIIGILTLIYSHISLASSELQARKDLAALNIKMDNSSFINAIKNNDDLVVKLFIDAGQDLEIIEPLQRHLANEMPKDILNYLIQTERSNSLSPYPEQVKQYLWLWELIKEIDGIKGTPLMYAILTKKNNMAKILLKNGAKNDSVIEYMKNGYLEMNVTPLSLSVLSMNLEMVKELIKVGVNSDQTGVGNKKHRNVANESFTHVVMYVVYGDQEKKLIYQIAKELDKNSKSKSYLSQVKNYKKIK
jgi:ankyrin repeat protein